MLHLRLQRRDGGLGPSLDLRLELRQLALELLVLSLQHALVALHLQHGGLLGVQIRVQLIVEELHATRLVRVLLCEVNNQCIRGYGGI